MAESLVVLRISFDKQWCLLVILNDFIITILVLYIQYSRPPKYAVTVVWVVGANLEIAYLEVKK